MVSKAQVRAMKRQDILRRAVDGQISWITACEALGLTPRQMRRIKARIRSLGLEAAIGVPTERKAANATSQALNQQICTLFRDKYSEFNVRHFFEKLTEEEKLPHVPCYLTVLNLLKRAQLVSPQLKRGRKYRMKRDRKQQRGMMLFMDGSSHAWFGPEHPKCDLVVVMDDASSEIYFAFFVKEENTASCMKALMETIRSHGVPISLYVDRATHFFKTRTKGDRIDPDTETQIKRALARIGCNLMPSYSPQARGRMERVWLTLQGRWPQEFQLRGVTNRDEANRRVGKLVKAYNRKFSVKPADPTHVFQPLPRGTNLELIFSLQTHRVVHSDHTVHFKNFQIQIPKNKRFPHGLAGSKVIVHELLSGEIAITYGDQILLKQRLEQSPGLKIEINPPITSEEEAA